MPIGIKEMDTGFVWDESKYRKVIEKHNVRFYEVVAAFDDRCGYELADPGGLEDRWLWVGKTPWNRILTIIYSEEELPLYRIITAFDTEGKWLDEYFGRQRI